MSKKLLKRLLAMALSVTMVAGSLTACGNTNEGKTTSDQVSSEEKETEELEEITITMAANTITPDSEATSIHKYIKEKFKINLEITEYNSDAWDSQFTLMMAGDELPDIVTNLGMQYDEFNEYASEGYFLNWLDYVDEMPNFKEILEENPDYKQVMTATDGNIYGLSQLTTIRQNAPARIFIDERWLENVDMEVPTNVDELYDVLVAFKNQDANGNGDTTDEVPMYLNASYNGKNNTFTLLANAFGILSDNITGEMCVSEDGTIYAPWNTENWKALLSYAHRLYEEELIDTNFVVRTSDEFKQMVSEERVGLFGANAPFAQGGKDISYDANFKYLGSLTSEYNDTPTLVTTSGASASVVLAVNSESEHIDRIVEFVDWLYTTEGALTCGLGVEGENWEWSYTDFSDKWAMVDQKVPEGFANVNEYKNNACIIQGAFSLVSPAEGRQYKIIDEVTDDVLYNNEDLVKTYGWAVLVEQGLRETEATYTPLSTLSYTKEEARERATLVTDIKSYVEQMTTQFITGEADLESDWDTYVKTLENMKLSRWVEIDQTAYDRVK